MTNTTCFNLRAMLRFSWSGLTAFCLVALGSQFPARAVGADNTPAVQKSPERWDSAIDQAIENEQDLLETLQIMRPVTETYIQELRTDDELGETPVTDHYFLGRMDLSHGLKNDSYIPSPGFAKRVANAFKIFSVNMSPRGWIQMSIIDGGSFDRNHYEFSYVKREFLGDLRCLVFDVKPKTTAGPGRFVGRIWIEDQDNNVVRFNGTYAPQPAMARYLHFDSWRVNCGPHMWVPAYAYSEENSLRVPMTVKSVRYKAQVRFWGYQTKPDQASEFTNLTVDAADGVHDESEAAADTSPVGASRLWERQAEDNVIDRLQAAGFVSPPGEVDKVLDTVLNNLEITNNIAVDPPIRVRVLLTTPLESLSVGHTIIISRGLLDVLPDEASLAAVVSHELAHILLGHQLGTKYAFTDRLLFDDDRTIKKVKLSRTTNEEASSDQRAIELLQKSPYHDKLPQAGLFLRQLSARSHSSPGLVGPLFGNRMVKDGGYERLASLMDTAPELRQTDVTQTAALPLGSRIKMDPWNDQLQLTKTQRVGLISAREKLPLQVTPFFLRLTREGQEAPQTVFGENVSSPPSDAPAVSSASSNRN